MRKNMTLAYTLAGVVVATSVIGVAASTTGLSSPADPGVQATYSTSRVRGADTVETTGSAAPPAAPALAEGERVTGTEIVQTAAGPVEYVYVDTPARRHDDDDDDDDDDERDRDEHEGHEDREEGSEAIRHLMALVGRHER